MLETYYLNFIARQLYAQKCLKYKKSQYWHPDEELNGEITDLSSWAYRNQFVMEKSQAFIEIPPRWNQTPAADVKPIHV